jgi:hypothetical protein
LPDPLRPKGAAGQGGEGEGCTQDLPAAFYVGAVNADHIGSARRGGAGLRF